MSSNPKTTRRDAVKVFGSALAASSALASSGALRRASTAYGAEQKPRFIIVLTCAGGASILDSFMAVTEAEAGANAPSLNCFPNPTGSPDDVVKRIGPFTALDQNLSIATLGGLPVNSRQSDFVRNHQDHMMVMTLEGTSVNHGIASARSMTGNDAWNGRMIQEAVAAQYGKQMPLANLSMAGGPYAIRGIELTLPDFAAPIQVADPITFPLGLHSTAGLSGLPADDLVELAQKARSEGLDPNSNFLKTFKDSPMVKRWLQNREVTAREFERQNLINKLFYGETTEGGLTPAEESAMLRDTFPNYMVDPLEAQAMTAYLAITRRLSAAVTLGPTAATVIGPGGVNDILNPPIAFDFSNTDHRGVQALMWQRVLTLASRMANSQPLLSQSSTTS
jgi:hypothetical protein